MTVAAEQLGAGGTAFAVVLALIIAMTFIFWAMIRSFKRLRKSVDTGTFGHPDGAQPPLPGEASDRPVSHDQTPGGASV
jgi:hypothetical protein